MSRIVFFFSFLFFSVTILAQDAIYKIEFISNWSSSTHPNMYPSGSAHWSPLVGATHKDAAIVFQLGVTATDGIEQVAETGGTSTITSEINLLITAGVADQVINGSGLGSGPGTITINSVNLDSDFPYISLITMIAPSPDWVAMIGNQKLTDTNGDWIQNLSVDVYATDAGTDGGVTYTSPNDDITPHENMTSLQNISPFSNEIIGTFVFTREQVLSTSEDELADQLVFYPNPSKGSITLENKGNVLLEKAEIYTATGKRLKTFKNVSRNLTLDSFKSGLYFLKLYSDKGNLTKKLIIE